MNENGRHFVNLANSRLLEIIHLEKKVKEQQAEIEALKPYKQKIELMEQAYVAHMKKSMGEVKDLIKKASEK